MPDSPQTPPRRFAARGGGLTPADAQNPLLRLPSAAHDPRISQVGSTKILIFTNEDRYFRQFLVCQPKARRFMFRFRTAAELRAQPRADIYVLGEFWVDRQWDSVYEVIKDKCTVPGQQLVRINWFPMGKGTPIDLSSSIVG